jgi:hypothetical protein
MPVIPDIEVRTPSRSKGRIFSLKPRTRKKEELLDGKNSIDEKDIISRSIRVIDGVTYRVMRIAPRPEGAMLDSRTIWGDGPRKRRFLTRVDDD